MQQFMTDSKLQKVNAPSHQHHPLCQKMWHSTYKWYSTTGEANRVIMKIIDNQLLMEIFN